MIPVTFQFAPVKNADNDADGNAQEDSPATASTMLSVLHQGWLRAAGATVEKTVNSSTGPCDISHLVPCEISPLISHGGENLDMFSGNTLKLPAYVP